MVCLEAGYTYHVNKRLQVLLADEEMAEIQRFAGREHLTVGERVRRALREACASSPAVTPRPAIS